LAAKLRAVESGLARYRNAKPFYADASGPLAPTKDDVDARIRSIGLNDAAVQFVQDKVHYEIGHADLHHDDRAIDLFVGRLLKHPEYAQRVRAAVQPVYAELLRAIQAKRGAVLNRAEIDRILRNAVAVVENDPKSITLWVQNWTREKFEPPADYELDWSAHFDRGTRRVPSEDVWNGELLPQLKSLKESILAGRTERVIRFRGKCALSTGIALGAAFPAVGGWTFEIPQPPAKEPWRSDAKPTQPYEFHVDLTDGGGSGSDLVLGLNIRGDGRDDIFRYVAGTGTPPRFFVFMAPSAPGSQSIGGPEDACAFAQSAREHLGQIVKDHRLNHTRLFFYGPLALSVFLGQQLTSVGPVQLFEYQDPGYVPSCLIKT
jgi:hypothetical protein